jgi:hypothetical protein
MSTSPPSVYGGISYRRLATPPDHDETVDTAAAIRERCDRIREDIISGQQKIERIQIRIERSRRALSAWEARLTGLSNENHSRQ